LRGLRALCLDAAVGRRDLVQNVLPSLRGSSLGKGRIATNRWPQGDAMKASDRAPELARVGAGRMALPIVSASSTP
jgi:hypothetical protein